MTDDMPDDPFEGLPPYDPAKFNPMQTPPPPAIIDKIMLAAAEARADLDDAEKEQFDQIMGLLSSMGFGAMLLLQAGGDDTLKVGEIMHMSDKVLIGFINFAATLSTVGINSFVPPDHPSLEAVGRGQVQVLMGLLVGYKLRQEQEGQ